MAQALQKAQQGRLELEDERARLEEECAALQRSLAEGASSEAGGAPAPAGGTGDEFLMQQLEEERARGRGLEAQLAAASAPGGVSEELQSVRVRLAEAEAARAGLERDLREALEERTIAVDQREDIVEALDTLRRQLAEIRRSAPPTPERPVAAPAILPGGGGDMKVLREKASGLERSRQILLSEVEAQNLEMERLFTENSQLARSAKEAREFAEDWEQQAGAAQLASARLQEMLEEQSDWRPSEANGALVANGAGPKEPAHQREAPAGDSEQIIQRTRDVETRNVALEAQVAQLNAEASRAQEAYSKLSRAIGPVLEGVEQRLARIRHEQYLRQQQQLAQ
jgi:hypothetical protein